MTYSIKIPMGGMKVNDIPHEAYKMAIRYGVQHVGHYIYRTIPDNDDDDPDDEIVAVSRHFYLRKRKEDEIESLSPRRNKERINVSILTPLTRSEYNTLKKTEEGRAIYGAATTFESAVERVDKKDKSTVFKQGDIYYTARGAEYVLDVSASFTDEIRNRMIGHYKITYDSYYNALLRDAEISERDPDKVIQDYTKEWSQRQAIDYLNADPNHHLTMYEDYNLRSLLYRELASFNDYVNMHMYSYDIVERGTRVVRDTLKHVTSTDLYYCTSDVVGESYLLSLHEKELCRRNSTKLIAGEFEL